MDHERDLHTYNYPRQGLTGIDCHHPCQLPRSSQVASWICENERRNWKREPGLVVNDKNEQCGQMVQMPGFITNQSINMICKFVSRRNTDVEPTQPELDRCARSMAFAGQCKRRMMAQRDGGGQAEPRGRGLTRSTSSSEEGAQQRLQGRAQRWEFGTARESVSAWRNNCWWLRGSSRLDESSGATRGNDDTTENTKSITNNRYRSMERQRENHFNVLYMFIYLLNKHCSTFYQST
jgi:hypothetical protein